MKTVTLESLIKAGNFDYVNSEITPKNFPLGRMSTDYKLYHFDEYITSEEVITLIEKEGYVPANLYELLSWKDWNREDWVIALGSVARVGGDRRAPALWEDGTERGLGLRWFDGRWDGDYRFLAVKVPTKPTSKDIENGELDASFVERFWKQVEKTDSCWNWTGAKHTQGYGLIKKGDTSVRAHRVSVLMSGREIPEGYQVDHLCRNTSCVRPIHLDVVTPKENTLRGNGITAKQARQTHCKRSHEFNDENTRLDSTNRRHCKSCNAVRKVSDTEKVSTDALGNLESLTLPKELEINGIMYKRV